jgi:hypothetical protein
MFINKRSIPVSPFLLILIGCVCLCSCKTANVRQQQTYLTGTSLAKIKNVAIMTSMTPPEVMCAQAGQTIAPFGILGTVIDQSARRSKDTESAGKIGNNLDIGFYEEKIARSFMTTLKQGDCPLALAYVKDKTQEKGNLLSADYDAVLKLDVYRMRMDMETNDKARLSIYIKVLMTETKTGNILLSREEFVSASESYPLDYYELNGLKGFESIIDKAGKKIAYDFLFTT